MTKIELQNKIEQILTNTPVSSAQEANTMRRQIATELANAIDKFVQAEIGNRLALITTSITCPAPAGVPTPAATFSEFIKRI
jgi:hypothetical protein